MTKWPDKIDAEHDAVSSLGTAHKMWNKMRMVNIPWCHCFSSISTFIRYVDGVKNDLGTIV